MTTYTVRLTDDTVGKIDMDTEPQIGEIVTVNLGDENGMPIKVRGELAEVLCEA